MKKICLLICVLLVGCSNDYAAICSYYDQLAAHPKLEQLSPNDKYLFIKDKMQALNSKNDAFVMWRLLDNVVPLDRYYMFKYGVKDISGQEWHCPSMEALAATIEREGEWEYVDMSDEELIQEPVSMDDAVFE